MKYNLLIVVSAEEEISGKKGIFSLLPILPKIEFAIIDRYPPAQCMYTSSLFNIF